MEGVIILVLALSLHTVASQEDPEYWNKHANDEIQNVLERSENTNVAKNVIMFLGDGMGVSTVTSARILKNLLNNNTDTAQEMLEFEQFDDAGLIKTYNIDYQTPDSAGTATAYLTGVKTNLGTIGVNARTRRGNCSSQMGNEVTSILDWSLAAGKSVGIVATSGVTHASPAALYAHVAERNWESDARMVNVTEGDCNDIAHQLIVDNPNVNVIFGGGRQFFISKNTIDPNATAWNSQRLGSDLTQKWQDDKANRSLSHAYVTSMKGFNSIDVEKTDYVLGLFGYGHMNYELDRIKHSDYGEPSIADMTRKAIQILSKNKKGFFLFVEGSRIDHAHHGSLGKKALHDVLAMDEAVAVAKSMTDKNDTLTVATADHSHGFNFIGYPKRGHNIFDIMTSQLGNDGAYNTPLLYANGPGHRNERRNYTHEESNAKNFKQDSVFGLASGTHSGEDVAVYAQGPMSHLLRSVHEQNYIAHVMAYASCVGAYSEQCGERPKKDTSGCTSGTTESTSGTENLIYMNHITSVLLMLTCSLLR